MKRVPTRVWVVLGILFSAGILQANGPQALISKWILSVSLSAPRASSVAVMLADGSILFTGGENSGTVLQSTEILDVNGNISSAADMNVPRSRHAVVILSEGRVLVGGGTTSGGGTTNSAEIYDPSANTWTQIGPMTSARANATAALLQDGRVLIAGGDNSGAPNNTIEIYDPTSGNFSFAGTLSCPRTQHAMAVLQDGRILIVGGFDGNTPLASTDIFDPVTGTLSAGPNLNTARYAFSAATLMNGQVVVIGGAGQGNNGSVDLASIEVFDPTANAFNDAGTTLTTAREGHQAFVLPNNNNVLIVGGTSGGTALPSAELLTPTVSTSTGTWTYAVSSTGSLITARAGASGSANQTNGPTSISQKPGMLLVAGGSDASGNTLSSGEVYGYPTVQTDQSDFAPGTTVTISGTGFTPGETVSITLVESPLIDTHGPYSVVADANGNFVDTSFATDIHDLNVRFWLSAVGTQSGMAAQNTFTDSQPTAVGLSPSSVAVLAGSNAVYTTNVTMGGNSNQCTVTLSVSPNPVTTGATPAFSGGANPFTTNADFSRTLTISTTAATTPGTYGFTVSAARGANCQGNGSVNGNGTLIVAGPATHFVVSGFPSPVTAGTPQSFTVTALDANNNTAVGFNGTVAFSSSDPQAVLPANYTFVSADKGVHQFSAALKTAGTQSITASASGVTPGLQTGITVNAAGTAQLVVAGYPSPVTAGTSNSFTVTAEDAFGNLTPGYTGTVHFTSSDAAATLPGNHNFTTGPGNKDNGVATFNATFNTAGLQSITATDTATASITGTQAGIVVNAAVVNTTTTVTSSSNPSTYGTAVTFTARVHANTGSTGPTGVVTPTIGGTPGNPVSLTACSPPSSTDSCATVSTSTLTVAGSPHSVSANYTHTGNFSDSSGSLTGGQTVNALPITATLTAQDKTYDGTTTEPNANLTCSLSGVLASDSSNVTCTATNGTFNGSNVGSHTVTATVAISGSAAGNYTLGAAGTNLSSTTANASANITTRTITASLTAGDKTYDGNNTEPTASMTCSFSGVLAADASNITCTPSGGTFNTTQVATANLVTATVTVGGSASGNYTLGAAGSNTPSTTATAAAHVLTAPLTATLNAQDKIYDGTASEPDQSMSCSVNGVVASDSGNVNCTPSNGAFNSSQVAVANQVSATVTISGAAAGNYTLGATGSSLLSTSASATAHIKTAPLTASLTAADKTYDGTNHEPNGNMGCSLSGVVALDTGNITCTPTNGTFDTSQVATASQVTATVTIGGGAAANYTLGAAGTSVSSTTASASAHIKTAPITATLAAVDKVYDSTATEPDGNMSCSFAGVIPSDNANVSCIAANGVFNSSQVAFATHVNATVTIGGAAGSNYTLGAAGTTVPSIGASASAHIKTAPLTATLTAADKVYDSTATEPDANMSCSFAGIVASDAGSVNCNATNGTFNSSQVVAANQVTATVTIGGSGAGNYTLGSSGTAVPSTSTSATAHIQTAPLTANLTGQDKQYDGSTTEPDASMHCSFSGVLPGDTANIVCTPSSGTFNTKDVLTANHVTATVTMGGTAAGNYTLGAAGSVQASTIATASAHITPKPVTATITATDKIYDGDDIEPDANMTCALPAGSIVNMDDVACVAHNGAFNSSQVLLATSVTANVSLTGTAAGNYSLTSASASALAHIKPKPVTASLTAADKTYDGNATEPDASMHCALPMGSAVGADDVGCAASNGAFNSSQVLTAITVTADVALTGNSASNYRLTSTTATANAHIIAKAVTVSFTAADRNYDSTTAATVSNCQIASGKVGNDDLSCTVSNGNFASKDASSNPQIVSATAALTGGAASNYSVANPVTSTATISPAPITVTADPQTKIFGQVDPALTYKVMNGALNTLFNGDSFTGGLSRIAGENVGSYAIQQGSLTAGTNYTISFVGANLTITQASSATVVMSSPSPSVFGQSVTFTATVTDATPLSTGTPTGNVQFYIDGILSGTSALNAGGQASITTSTLSVATHAVYAKYIGDQNFIGSTSASIYQVVNKANTSVAVATSGSPSTLNSPVTFTATVSVVSPGAGSPTGTVTFYLDSTAGTQLGTAPVSSGMAAITTSAVPVNTHTIIAVYSGDGSFNTSNGSVTQLVQYLSGGMCAGDVGHAIRQPINQDGSSVWKANATVPAKFAVCNANGVSIGTPGVVSAFTLVAIIKGTITTNVNEVPDSTTPDTIFRWDPTGQQWIFNINTKSAPVNVANQTYLFKISLNDGSAINFQFGLR